jgi:hypothetical protein
MVRDLVSGIWRPTSAGCRTMGYCGSTSKRSNLRRSVVAVQRCSMGFSVSVSDRTSPNPCELWTRFPFLCPDRICELLIRTNLAVAPPIWRGHHRLSTNLSVVYSNGLYLARLIAASAGMPRIRIEGLTDKSCRAKRRPGMRTIIVGAMTFGNKLLCFSCLRAFLRWLSSKPLPRLSIFALPGSSAPSRSAWRYCSARC